VTNCLPTLGCLLEAGSHAVIKGVGKLIKTPQNDKSIFIVKNKKQAREVMDRH